MIRQSRRYNLNPPRRKIPGVGSENQRGSRTPISFAFEVSTVNLIAFFDQPVIFSGILPRWSTGIAGADVVSVTRNSAISYTIVYDVSIALADSVLVPFEDPSFRNANGGYVNAGTVLVSTP